VAASPLAPFHLAVPVHDLDAARAFYGGVLGLSEGAHSLVVGVRDCLCVLRSCYSLVL